MFVTPLFKLMSDKQASDMYLNADAPKQIKINGTVLPVNNLASVISQRMLKTVDGKRAAAVEVLLNTKHIQELIKSDEIPRFKEAMEQNLSPGSQTFEQALFKLYQAGRISMDEALACSDSPTNVHSLISNSGKSTISVSQQPAAGTAPSAESARPASSSGDLSSIKLDLDGLF